MSLEYIIDGYNLINHRLFAGVRKKTNHPQKALLDFIRTNKLCGSPKNKIVIVFDGYPPAGVSIPDTNQTEIIYSYDTSADQRIKDIIEKSNNPKRIIVVSDDKEVRLHAGFSRAIPLGVGDFIGPKEKAGSGKREIIKCELNYSQIAQINKELKSIWLKA